MEELYSFIIDFGFVKYFSTYIFLKIFERFWDILLLWIWRSCLQFWG